MGSENIVLSVLFNVKVFDKFHNLLRSCIRLLAEYLILIE